MGQMTMNIYNKALKSRYLKGNRKTKSRILDEFCATNNYNRKSAIRLLTRRLMGTKDKPVGRKKIYDPKILLDPLKAIWLATDQMCGPRLKAALPLWLPYYEARYPLSPSIREQLLAV